MTVPNILTDGTYTNSGVLISDSFPAQGGVAGAGNSRVVVVTIATKGNSAAESLANACQLNGVNMIQYDTIVSGAGFNTRATVYYLLEANLPVVPAPWTIVVTTGGSQGVIATVMEIENALTPDVSASFGSISNQGSWSNNITPLLGDSLVIDAMSQDTTTTTESANGSQVEIGTSSINNGTLLTSSLDVPIAALTSMGWSWTNNSNRQAHSILTIPPSIPAVGGAVPNAIMHGMNF